MAAVVDSLLRRSDSSDGDSGDSKISLENWPTIPMESHPAPVMEMTSQQLAQLGAEDQALLEVASVAGKRILPRRQSRRASARI